MKAIIGLLLLVLAQDVWATCREAGELCKPGVECCTDKGLVCTPRPGASSICVAGGPVPSATTTSTVKPGVTTTTTTVKGTTTSTTVKPVPPPRTPEDVSTAPVRFQAKHVGLVRWRVFKDVYKTHTLYFHPITGKTATNVVRFQMIEYLQNVEAPFAGSWVDINVPGCSTAGLTAQLNENFVKLATTYTVDRGLATSGRWVYRETIYDWTDVLKALKGVSQCLTGGKSYTCGSAVAKEPAETQRRLRELLDFTIATDALGRVQCLEFDRGTFVVQGPIEKKDGNREEAGTFTTRVPHYLSAADVKLVDRATAAHGHGPDAPVGVTAQQAHVEFEKAARDETDHAVRAIHPFGGRDPRYTPAENEKIAGKEHVRHVRWNGCYHMPVRSGPPWAVAEADQLCAWLESIGHGWQHVCHAWKNPGLRFRQICTKGKLAGCPIVDCDHLDP